MSGKAIINHEINFVTMRKIYLLFILAFILNVANAQILNPVRFDYSVVKKGTDSYELHIKTKIEPHWHLYSVNNPEGGAQATVVKLKQVKALGKVKEVGKLISVHDAQFNVNQKYFENTVDFVQTVKGKNIKVVSGTIEYMVCNDRQCLPPKEVEFKVKL